MSMWYPSPVTQRGHPDHKRLGLWGTGFFIFFWSLSFIFSQRKAAKDESEGELTIFFQGFSLQSNE